MKKIISAILVIAIALSLGISALAVYSTPSEAGTVTVTYVTTTGLTKSDSAQTAYVYVYLDKDISYSTVGIAFASADTTKLTIDSNATTTLTGGLASKKKFAAANAADQALSSCCTLDENGYLIGTIPVTIAAGVVGDVAVNFNGDFFIETGAAQAYTLNYPASATLTISEPAAEGYTVALSSSADSVETGDTLEVYLDVTNANVTTFNDVDLTLTYDSANFTFEKESSLVNGFSVETTTAGTLVIRGYGNDILISDGHEFTLKFTAGDTAEENLAFALTSAKVDVADRSNKDVPEATPSGSPVTVSIIEPVVPTYTVTFVGGEDAAGTAPTQEDTAADDTFALPANTFTKTGYTFIGWSDGTTTYQAGATYTMPAANVTFTAQWKLNDPVVTPETITTYLSGYTLIKATIADANGNVPTYDGNAMYQITNVSGKTAYDADAYYYIVKTGEYDPSNVGFGAVTAATITKDGDANQTGVIDINDAQFVYNLYNTDTITVPYTPTAAQLLASDVNGDGEVNSLDPAAIVPLIP